MKPSQKKVKVKVHAEFHRLQLNKNIKFQTHILWKRHTNKSQTKLVSHEHGYSIFNQQLCLELNMVYDEDKETYEDKNTEIVAIINYDGRVKSGGYAKFNAAKIYNEGLENKIQKISLSQCPDPNANIQATFYFEFLDDLAGQTSSILNASSRDLNMSRINFNDDKISLEMDRINKAINKFNQLAQIVKVKEKASVDKIPKLNQKIEMMEGEKIVLIGNIAKLEAELDKKEKKFKEDSKDDKKMISDLQKQLNAKDKRLKSQQFIEIDKEKQIQETKNKEVLKYRKMYEEATEQLEKIKQDKSRQKRLGIQQKSQNGEMANLKTENNELRQNIAEMSFKLAQLFNSSYQYGGAKLLDYLQTSIGLTQL